MTTRTRSRINHAVQEKKLDPKKPYIVSKRGILKKVATINSADNTSIELKPPLDFDLSNEHLPDELNVVEISSKETLESSDKVSNTKKVSRFKTKAIKKSLPRKAEAEKHHQPE